MTTLDFAARACLVATLLVIGSLVLFHYGITFVDRREGRRQLWVERERARVKESAAQKRDQR